MSSQESREARQKRMHRQAQGSRDVLAGRSPRHREPEPGPTRQEMASDPWSDEYIGEDPHDDEYFQDRELNFEEN